MKIGTVIKWIVGGAVLGGGMLAADVLYTKYVDPRLPVGWQGAQYASGVNMKPLIPAYVARGALAVAIVGIGAPLLGLSGKSPIKPGAAPV